MKAVCIHVALCGLVTAVVSGCDQPKPNCLSAQAPFVLKLEETGRSDPAACLGFGPSSFYEDPHVGVIPFYPRDSKGQPDYRKGTVAIRTAEMGNLAANVEAHVANPPPSPVLHSIGKFTTEEPDGEDLCRVPAFDAPTVVNLPTIDPIPDDPATPDDDESFPGQPAVRATLTWSDLDVYVTPASLGTQMRAKLTDTRVAPDGRTCTINYNVRGLAPAVPCYKTKTQPTFSEEDGTPVVREDGTPVLEEVPDLTPDGKRQVDQGKCSPEPAPNADPPRFSGSGISPTTNAVCDPETFYCVLAGTEFPALK